MSKENKENKEKDSKTKSFFNSWTFRIVLILFVLVCAAFFGLVLSLPKWMINAEDSSVSITYIICLTLLAITIIISCVIVIINLIECVAASEKENPSKSYYEGLSDMLCNTESSEEVSSDKKE